MLKTLRRKFVAFTTLISIVVIIAILFAINFTSYISTMQTSDSILNMLVQNDSDIHPDMKFPHANRLPQEVAFTTRFFVVSTDYNANIKTIDIRNISSVTIEGAAEYVEGIKLDNDTSGTVGNFRYLKTENDIGYSYIFLDIEKDLISYYSFLNYSVIVLIIAAIFIFLLSCIASKSAVKPIVESYQRQKSFITDVSHEFKTPLSIMKADNEIMELDYGESEWTESIKNQINRLNMLVESLITLTKFDEGNQVHVKTDFSLSDATVETLGEFASSAQSAEVNIVSNVEGNITYNGDETAIRKLVMSLVENAIKYSLKNTDIRVGLYTKGSKSILTVQNKCENIEIGKHNNWFERFYREDKSRNSEKKGFGIGLSIVKTICDGHGAKISAESKTGNEVIITVAF